MYSEMTCRIALTLVPGLGPVLARRLVSIFGSAAAIFRERSPGLIRLPGINAETAYSIKQCKYLERAEQEVEYISKKGIKALFYTDDEYPRRLKLCHDAPLLLYARGKGNCLDHPRAVAVIGSRRMTEYGRQSCERLVGELSGYRTMIVSGLAYGVDACAHDCAAGIGLPMVAVLGHGLDRIYPGAHYGLASRIEENGLLVTEFISGRTPVPENFPRRNRIIAGLSDAVIVIEAALRGGALITADIANSYNRDVFALPGRVSDRYSQGCNRLIRINKAHLIESASDMQYIMNWEEECGSTSARIRKPGRQAGIFVILNREEKIVADFLRSNGEAGIDSIVSGTGFNLGTCTTVLLGLEFKGVVRALPGRTFRLMADI